MSKLLRYFRPGQTYFITNVTKDRSPLIAGHYELLLQLMNRYRRSIPFYLFAYVLLPQHLHLLLASESGDPATIMLRLKLSFANLLRIQEPVYSGHIWQPRYWDHIIRDEADLMAHLDYIHFNPVKHGYVLDPALWPYSSFTRYQKAGFYPEGWGVVNAPSFEGDFGE